MEYKMSKWTKWYDSLPPHTKKYLDNQPIWKDSEMRGAVVAAFVVGILIGLCF
jgi:hypothetical protein